MCPPCAAAPFAESIRPIDKAKDGVGFLNRSMFEILIPLASERDQFETGKPQGEQTSLEEMEPELSRPDEVESINSEAIPPPWAYE